MNLSTLRTAAPALVLSVLMLAPFLHKPFTIDDPVFMREAGHVLEDPLHPTAFDVVWEFLPVRVSRRVPTGPVMGWLLAPAALASAPEATAHAIELAMLWVGILATVSLALRLGLPVRWASASGVLLVSAPAVAAMAGTAMPDVPAMALGAIGLERLVAWGRNRRVHQAVLAALLLGLAALTRSHALLLLGVGVILAAGTAPPAASRRERLQLFLPVGGAVLVVALLTFVTRDPLHGAGGIVEAATFFSSLSTRRLASNAVAFPIHWVVALPLAPVWLLLRGRAVLTPRHAAALGVGTALSAAGLAHCGRGSVLLGIAAGLGLTALWDVLADARGRRDVVQGALALWLLVALCALPYVHLPAKLLVLSAPAAALLLARQAAARPARLAWPTLAAAAVAGMALGVAILRADQVAGELGRRAAAELVAPHVAAGRKVWLVGHWGFQWYAENAGGRHVTLTPPYPEEGDVLVVSVGAGTSPQLLDLMANRFPDMLRLAQVSSRVPGGRIMDRSLEAGFYSNAAGYLPWTWGRTVIDGYLAFELRRR